MERCITDVIGRYEAEIDAEHGDGYAGFLRWLAMICIHCNPAAHCELRTPPHFWREHIEPRKSLFAKPEGDGAAIGRLVMQHAMGLYINDIVAWLNDDCGIRTTFFVDDGVMVVPEERHRYALSLMPAIRRRFAEKGLHLNERKFYDQPYRYGMEFLGTHVKPYRIHLNNTTCGRAVGRVRELNAIPDGQKLRHIGKFISCFNSYTGLLKNRTDYGRIVKLKGMVAAKWWEYLQWDGRRLCVVARPGFTRRDLLLGRFRRCRSRRRRNRIKSNQKT